MYTLISTNYMIRPPQNSAEWDVVKKLLMDYRAEFNDDACFTSFDKELSDIESLYTLKGNVKLIAISEIDGGIAGCIAVQAFSPTITEMKRLYVAPAHRGQQLGKTLVETIIALTKMEGYEKIYLDTMLEMKAAQHLYDQLGFVVISPYDDQDVEKMICYEKNLNQR